MPSSALCRNLARQMVVFLPQREAEEGAAIVAPQGAAKVQEGAKGVWELAEQVRLLKADLEARLGGRDARQVAAVRVKHDRVVPRHKHGHVRQVVDRVEAQPKPLHSTCIRFLDLYNYGYAY